jgi:hypothetical protein
MDERSVSILDLRIVTYVSIRLFLFKSYLELIDLIVINKIILMT